HGFADFCDPAFELERRSLRNIVKPAVARDFHARVVAPVRRISDLVLDSLQLDDGLFFCLRRHPAEALNVGTQSSLDGMNHLQRAGFAVRREGAIDVGLSERFAKIAICGMNAATPARKLLLRPGKG